MKKLALFVLIMGITLSFTGCGQSEAEKARDTAEMTEIKSQRLAREWVQANLKDGSSAEFRNQKRFCGEVNAKNGFGAYMGFKRFLAVSSTSIVTEDMMKPGEFDKAWQIYCN